MNDDTTVLNAGTDTGTSTDTSTSLDTGLDFDINDTGAETVEQPTTETQSTEQTTETQPTIKEDPETQDFAGHVSGKIRRMMKEAPELGKILATHPNIKATIEATMRRDAAYRDVFPTVAEAKAMRERFPNGLQDVQALEEDVKEIEGIDNLTYMKDQDGNYAGHSELINNIFTSDRNAAVALFKTLPKEWARLDRDSYNDVMGKIVGATLVGTGSWEQLIELREHVAATDGLKGLVPGLDKVLNRLAPFVEERRPDPGQEALNRDRQQLDRQRQADTQKTNEQFNRSFQTEGVKQQREIVSQHKVIQKLAAIKTITPQKRAEIVDKVCLKMQQFLKNSPAFMRKVTAAYQSRDLDGALKIQRATWTQEWLLNRMVRDVLKVETPQLINANRTTVQTRTGQRPPVKSVITDNGNKTPTGPFKSNGQWFHKDGRRMTTVEAMRQEMASS